MKTRILSLTLALALCMTLTSLPVSADSSGSIRNTGAGTITYDGSSGGAVKPDGTLWTWGEDMTGQLGSNQTYERNEMSTSGIPCGVRETPLQTLNPARWGMGLCSSIPQPR